MRTGRPKTQLVLSDEERVQLQSFARSRSLPAALSNRARLVLASAQGEPNNAIAARLKMSEHTVGKWRMRFIERRIAGLYDDVRPGAPRTIDDERLAQLIVCGAAVSLELVAWMHIFSASFANSAEEYGKLFSIHSFIIPTTPLIQKMYAYRSGDILLFFSGS